MAVLDDILSDIGLPSVRMASRRSPQAALSPAEEQSILGTIGQSTMSGLQWLGETLDKPGRAVRGLLAGRPGDLLNLVPFSDTVGLTDPQRYVSGRDLLEQYGLLSANTPGLDTGDVAGFAAEVLLDPTMYMTLGASALGKGGQVAKRAGLMKQLAEVTGKGVGPIEGRMTTTLNKMLAPRAGEHVRDPFDFVSWAKPTPSELRTVAAQTAAEKMGVSLADVADEPLGGLLGVGRPFRDSSQAVGIGARSQAVAGRLDKLVDSLRWNRPVAAASRLVRAPEGDATSYVGQKFLMPSAFDAATAGRAEGRGKAYDLMADLARVGGPMADDARAMRRLYEGIDTAASPEMTQHFDKFHAAMSPLVTRAKAIGMPAEELIDDTALYATRQLTGVPSSGNATKVMDVVDPNFAGRDPMLKNLGEGTDTLLQIRHDPVIGQLREVGNVEGMAAEIGNRFGGQVPATFTDANGVVRDQREALAKWFSNLDDDVWESGVFGNHPLVDAAGRMAGGYDRVAVAEDLIGKLDMESLSLAQRTSRSSGQSRTLRATFDGMGLKAGNESEGAIKAWMERRGMPVTKDAVEQMGKLAVPLDLSDDMIRRMQTFKSPEVVGEIMKAIVDPITNITKAGLTSAAPAFHVRNLGSGQWQNAQAGMFSLRSFNEARALAEGGSADLLDIPSVRQLLQQQGLAATPENASDAIRRLVYQWNIVSPQQSIAATQGRTGAPQAFADLVAESPGGVVAGRGRPFRLADAADKLLGRSGATTWNPLNADVRGGFTNAAETTLAPIAAGEHVGSYVEFLNRVAPFIHELRKGVDPAEAAARVFATQVDYSARNYTAFEKTVLHRLVPFAKFTTNMVPYTIRRLWEKPGGAIAQTIRAQNDAGGDPTAPDYVRETAAIALGELPDGSKRYVTGFGLPFEDAASFLGGGVQGALLEAGSRLNPLAKAPLEWMTGESFFQKGPQGGRELEDLDPTIGRTLSNIAGLGDGSTPTGYVKPVDLPDAVEFIAGNSPLSRLLTTLRAATDERKHNLGGVANLLTGVKVTDVSPQSQDAATRERMQALMKQLGARSFENVYFPKDDVAEMPPDQQLRVLQLEALKQELVRRTKERKAAADK